LDASREPKKKRETASTRTIKIKKIDDDVQKKKRKVRKLLSKEGKSGP